MLTHWNARSLPALLADHGLADVAEEPFPNDGWSGASLTLLRHGDARFVLKRSSWAADWIARHTRDHALREAFVAAARAQLPRPLVAPYLGAAADGSAAAVLMPDLSRWLFAWDRPGGDGPASPDTVAIPALERVLDAIARLHALPAPGMRADELGTGFPWCPLPERLTLLTRSSAEQYRQGGLAVGERFLAGWDAFDRLAPTAARSLVDRLTADVSPLVEALGTLPATMVHGDLKLANVALLDDGRVALIDWQMTSVAPVAVELAWLLVANVGQLPLPPADVLARYRAAALRAVGSSLELADGGWSTGAEGLGLAGGSVRARDRSALLGDWEAQADLTWIVGLLLRGWRKGLDAEAGVRHPWGVDGASDLRWWCEQALAAADRRL